MACALSSCNRVEHLESVKSQDLSAAPKNIYGYIASSSFSSDKAVDDFKKGMVEGLAQCGIRLQFQPGALPSVSPPAGFTAVLGFRELAHEATTVSRYTATIDKYNDMYRLEIDLIDVATKKTVWKSQGDFRTKDNAKDKSVFHVFDESASAAWSETVLGEMKKDGLLTSCGPNYAIAPGVITSAAPVPGAAPVPVPTPVAVSGTAAAAAGAPAAGPAKPSSYKVNNVTYASLGEAEAAMRANATKEVSQLAPFSGTPRSSLVIVPIGDKQAKIASTPGQTPAQLEPIMAYMHMVNQVGYDTTVDAVRKSNLFSQVTLARGGDVADDDFKGAAYKIWFSGGSWNLAKQGGAPQKVSAPTIAEPKAANLNGFLTSVRQAADAADKG